MSHKEIKSEPSAEGNEEGIIEEKLEELQVKNPVMFIITESVLIIAAIPTILFFILGIINGLLLLIEQDNYLI